MPTDAVPGCIAGKNYRSTRAKSAVGSAPHFRIFRLPEFSYNVDDFIAVAEAEFDGRQIVVFDLSDIFGPQSRQFLFRRGDTVYQDRHTAIGRGDLIGLAVDSDLRNLVGQIETRDRRLPVFIGDGYTVRSK